MSDCIFCKIIAGDIPSSKVYEDENVYAFRDINPQAPKHVLVIPRKHIASVAALTNEDAPVAAACLLACRKVAELEGMAENGFRVTSNSGDDACQSVHHLHFHVMGGKKMSEGMA